MRVKTSLGWWVKAVAMSDDLREQIYLNFRQRETEDLLEIWRTHDRHEWSVTTFDVIREILQERHVEPPPQDKPVYEAHKLKPAVIRGVQQERHVESPPQKETSRPANRRGVELTRPQTVIYAVYLGAGGLAIQAALAFVNLLTGELRGLAAGPQFAVVMGLTAVSLLLLEAFMLYGAWLGRNGPRIFYVGLTLFSFVSILINGSWTEGWSAQPSRTSLSILAMCLDLIAVTLLVLPLSNDWFRAMRPTRASEQQATQRKKQSSQSRRSPTWLSELSPDRWVRHYTFGILAISFAVGLLASWLVYNLVLWFQKPDFPLDSFLNAMYAMSCLPVQAVALILGAVIGAISTRIPGARWQRATYGVWIATLVAIVVAIFGAGGIPNADW